MRYDKYRLTFREMVICVAEYVGICIVAAYLFYDSYIAFALLLCAVPVYVGYKRKGYIHKRTDCISEQFMQTILSVSSAVNAGISAENAFIDAKSDMEKLYGRKADIVKELIDIENGLSIGRNLEDLIGELADRTQIEEIKDFAVIFRIAKQNGSGFGHVIAGCVMLMQTNKETEREIRTIISGRVYEQKIMSVVPLAIMGYMRNTSSSFMDVLYHNPFGIAVMSGCLGIYILSLKLSEKICDIKV